MELKKSKIADLESKRTLFFQLGIVIVLGVLLLAFEWTSQPSDDVIEIQKAVAGEEEMMQVTRQEPVQPPPPPPPPQVVEMINIVEDDVDIDEFEFDDIEANEDLEMEFVPFDEDEEETEEEVFFIVEDMPTFQGGDLNTFRNWVQSNLDYPEIAAENGISGRVFIQFAVSPQGKVVDVVVARGVDKALDDEAVRVVKSSPVWNPGKQRGRPVKVQFTFPIVFVLQ